MCYGSDELDASLLMMPLTGNLRFDQGLERVQGEMARPSAALFPFLERTR
jgi:hypothetical protein